MADYTAAERELLRAAEMIFYPTPRFVDLFATSGKKTFPSVNCYRLGGDRLKQTALLRLLNVPYPRTRVYYGHRQKRGILKDFVFPFMAKRPFDFSQSGQVFFVNDQAKLDWYNQHFNPSYIQEYVGAGQELRLIVLNYDTLFAYRRQGGTGFSKAGPTHSEVCRLDKISPDAVELAKKIAWDADLSEVTIDMIYDGSRYRVLDLRCQCCEEGWSQAGEDRVKVILEMIERGEL
jgi:ribosomal protein S6--L-glutamate ligase